MLSPPFEWLKQCADLQLQGNFEEAFTMLREGIDSLSANSDALPTLIRHFAVLCERSKRPMLGIEYVKKGLAAFPEDLSLLYHLAEFLIATGQTIESRAAVENFRIACKSSSNPLRDSIAELQPGLDAKLAKLFGST